jgi:hypothetical protein
MHKIPQDNDPVQVCCRACRVKRVQVQAGIDLLHVSKEQTNILTAVYSDCSGLYVAGTC